jgi:peptidoglycan LD-endopeptidase LytH
MSWRVPLLLTALIAGAVIAWLWSGARGPELEVRESPAGETMLGRAPETMPPASPDPAATPAPSAPASAPTTPGQPAAPAPAVAAPAPGATLVVPVTGVAPSDLTDTFGDARGGDRSHEALDIMAPAGTPVVAVADGHVEKLFDSDAGGLTIYQFEPGGTFAYYYAHLQSYAPGLAEGQAIRRGQVIGYVGSTGNADPAAPHLHFAIFRLGPEREWWKGTPINPYPLLRGEEAQR